MRVNTASKALLTAGSLLLLYIVGSGSWAGAPEPAGAGGHAIAGQPAPWAKPVYRIDTGRFVTLPQMDEALANAEGNRGKKDIGASAPEGEIRCLTLPHHLPAAGLSIYALKQVASAEEKPEVVILLGPNHGNTGPAAAVTSANWQTPYGEVGSREDLVAALVEEGMAEESPSILEGEHSMGLVIPWLAKFLPGAKVVPLIFYYGYPLDDLERLFAFLEAQIGQKYLLIVSADFSHHHARDEAARLDRKTISLLETNDWRAIAGLSSDYLDCPTLVAAMMRFGSAQGMEGPAVLAHTNTGFLTGVSSQEVTSYFVLAYTERE